MKLNSTNRETLKAIAIVILLLLVIGLFSKTGTEEYVPARTRWYRSRFRSTFRFSQE